MPRATRRKVLAPIDENVVGEDTSTTDVLQLIQSIETQGMNVALIYVIRLGGGGNAVELDGKHCPTTFWVDTRRGCIRSNIHGIFIIMQWKSEYRRL